MNKTGTRGKKAEGIFRKWAKQMSDEHLAFALHRFPDARAGSFVTVPSDFEVLYYGVHYNIEVKEVDHDFRLPHKNFSADKRARMRKWEHAGSEAWVLVYFTPLKLWRVETIGRFMLMEGGSWDLSDLKLMTFDEAMRGVFK